jgi:dipeptidyl aminopeptidase/acylaminoacyl peptidase
VLVQVAAGTLALAVAACTGGGARELEREAVRVPPVGPIRTVPEPTSGPLPGRVVFHDRGGDLWTMRGDGTVRRRLTQSGEGFDLDPAWSPDGRLVVFRSTRDPSPEEGLLVIDADGSGERTFRAGAAFADWSPDGRHVVFSAAGGRISVADRAGGNVRSLGAAWLPDGRLLISIDYSARAMHGWYVMQPGSRRQFMPVLRSLAAVCCGEGQLDWLP